MANRVILKNENYIKSMNLNATTLSELRLQLIDIRV